MGGDIRVEAMTLPRLPRQDIVSWLASNGTAALIQDARRLCDEWRDLAIKAAESGSRDGQATALASKRAGVLELLAIVDDARKAAGQPAPEET